MCIFYSKNSTFAHQEWGENLKNNTSYSEYHNQELAVVNILTHVDFTSCSNVREPDYEGVCSVIFSLKLNMDSIGFFIYS